MFLKFIGSGLIILASIILGYVFSGKFKRRCEELRDMQALLNLFKNEISFMSNFLKDAFKRVHEISNSHMTAFFKNSAEVMMTNPSLDANKAWILSIENNIKNTCLDKEDKLILLSFGKALGNSDLEGQIKNIELTVEQLKLQEKKAENSRLINENIYKNLGILGGLALVVILF